MKRLSAPTFIGRRKNLSGFTLVELLVVIAIIAILAAVVLLIINPLELTRRGRDATRLSDMANLQQAINVAVQEATNSGAAILCFNTGTYPCNGNSVSGTRNANGTGWVQVNLGAQQSVSVPTLPADATNSNGAQKTQQGTFHYVYCADNDQWEINANMESNQQQGRETTDGGDDDALYEVGSNLGLVGVVSVCTW